MKQQLILSVLLVFTGITTVFGQVGIGTATPNTSSMLDISSTNKGFLPPRVELVSETDATTIMAPATWLTVYQTGNTALKAGLYSNIGTPSSPIWNNGGIILTDSEGSKVYKTKYRGRNSAPTFPKPVLTIPEMNIEFRFGEVSTGYNALQVKMIKAPTTNVDVVMIAHWQGASHGNAVTTNTFTPTNYSTWQTIPHGYWSNYWGYYMLVTTNENRNDGGPDPLKYSMNMYGLCGWGLFGNPALEPYTLAAEVF